MRVTGGNKMVTSKVRCNLLLLGILVMVQLELALALEYFTRRCGQTIDISTDHSEQLDSQISLSYDPYVDCTVTIETSLLNKVLVTFERVDIEWSSACDADYLEIYDGPNLLVNKLATICGSSTQSAIASTVNSITLTFRTDSIFEDRGFYIIVTSFSTGFCSFDEFRCDNGRCIDESLKDNLRDNCGDSSDESLDDLVDGIIGWSIGIIVGVIVGCLVGGILICVCCGCLCYHLCCKSKPTTTTTVVVPTGHQQQPYGQQPGAPPPGAYNQQHGAPPPGAYNQQPGAPPPAYNQPPMAMQQIPGQYGQKQEPYNVAT
ncbi:uncharacterized protein [Asterias amurensis]|uniref:uncharacterized protein isoform X2 n=1 Tax=Asterias amurensis TaxID=7602 RepID=UPI003AB411D1